VLQVTAILGKKMETHNEVFYNNLLSIPFVCGLILLFGEHTHLQARPSPPKDVTQMICNEDNILLHSS
jgi:hypothetical protein